MRFRCICSQALTNVTTEEQERYRSELLGLQVCIIAPQT